MANILQPIDIAVALSIALRPHTTYATMATDLGLSPSTAHQSVKRLLLSGLVRKTAKGHVADIAALEEFVFHGVRYAFPAVRGKRQRGVPTAHAAPVLRETFDSNAEPFVWPSKLGSVVGTAIEPLIHSAATFSDQHRALYEALALVDSLRVGTARERDVARRMLTERFEELRA